MWLKQDVGVISMHVVNLGESFGENTEPIPALYHTSSGTVPSFSTTTTTHHHSTELRGCPPNYSELVRYASLYYLSEIVNSYDSLFSLF